jgi:hypothetical protein
VRQPKLVGCDEPEFDAPIATAVPVMVDPGPNGMALEAPAAGIGFRMHEAEKK